MKLLPRLLIVTALVAALPIMANAGQGSNASSRPRPAFVNTPPFVGEKSESLEGFSPQQAYAALTILDGAMISGPALQIYGASKASVADGTQGITLLGRAQSATIVFPNPVSDFGAYWGSMETGSSLISFTFLDASGNEVATDSFSYTSTAQNGALVWRGYHFSTAVKTVIYSGDNVVTDALQIIFALRPPVAPLVGTTPTVTVSAAPNKIAEGEDATYTIQCSPPPTTPITVSFVMRGDAQENVDYGLEPASHQVTFAPGQAVATIILHSVLDTIPERGESATMVLVKGPGYRLGTPSSCSVIIKNVPNY
ncbi:MAG: hypothetical protein QOI04_75 [Verrucomicrobiota bacterium]|jgi:hypothetical protein